MIFVSLFLAGKTAALCFSVTPSFVFFLRSRLVRLGIVLMPLVFAGWVAVTRIEDYVGHSPNYPFQR
jgi:diacylglycerol diphosphate phosphatase / phosphatidate phosphatase